MRGRCHWRSQTQDFSFGSTMSKNMETWRWASVSTRIDEIATQFPERIALIDAERSMSYAELTGVSNELAARLIAQGVEPDEQVALYMERSLELVVGMLGIMKAGAAYVPLDPAYPAVRRRQVIEGARIERAVCGQAQAAQLDALGVERHVLERRLGVQGSGPTPFRPRVGRLAYTTFTSGSTGTPKGIVTTHANLAHFLMSMQTLLELGSESVCLFRTSASFDPHTLEVFLPLMQGGKVVVAPSGEHFSVEALDALIVGEGVNVIQATPSIWSAMLRGGWRARGPITAISGGEALPEGVKDRLLEQPDIELWNAYGPTETTVWCCAQRMSADEPVRLGGPFPGVGLHVLGEDMKPVAELEVGELCVDGPGLALGYLHQVELSARAFVPHPFTPGERLYKTGDLVRRLPGGQLEFLGRNDQQVKIRGHRIELSEVELAVEASGAVSKALVLAEEGQRLIAYLIADEPNQDQVQLIAAIRSELERRLPHYMVPAQFVVVERFPLTPNLKIDRLALARLRERSREVGTRLPEGGALAELASVWQELLGPATLVRESDFFALGGHSLNIVQLRVSLLRTFGVDLSVAQLHAHPRLEAMSELIASQGQVDPQRRSSASLRPGWVPLSPSQLGLFEEIPAEAVDRSNLEFMVRTRTRPAQVRAAIERLVARHEVFWVDAIEPEARRMRFGAEPVLGLEESRGGYRSEAEFFAALGRCRDAVRPSTGVMYRWLIAPVGDQTYVYFIGTHLLFDGISLDILADELDLLLADHERRLLACASYREWLEAQMSGLDTYRAELSLWAGQVQRQSVSAKLMSSDRRGGGIAVLPRCLATRTAARASEPELLAAGVHALGLSFGLDSVPCRVVHSGRGLTPGLRDSMTVGWLAHQYPMWVELGARVDETATHTREALAAVPGRGRGYGWLRAHSEAPALLEGLSISEFIFYFNLRSSPGRRRLCEAVDFPRLPQARSGSVGLALMLRSGREELGASLCFDRANMRSETADAFFARFEACLGASASARFETTFERSPSHPKTQATRANP